MILLNCYLTEVVLCDLVRISDVSQLNFLELPFHNSVLQENDVFGGCNLSRIEVGQVGEGFS